MRAAPGGPFQSEKEMPAQAKAQLLREYGLDRPLAEQYVSFLAQRGAASTSGPRTSTRSARAGDHRRRLPGVGSSSGAWALLFSLLVGVPIGVLAAVRQNQWLDYAAMGLALAGVSIPNFVLGPVLVLVFALRLYLAAAGAVGRAGVAACCRCWRCRSPTSPTSRGSRAAGMLEVLRQDFIRTARAKGLAERVVVLKHALKLGILPVVSLPGARGGAHRHGLDRDRAASSRCPGLGRYLVKGAFNRDYTLVMGVVLFYAGFLMALNLLVDVAYTWLDPRVELA